MAVPAYSMTWPAPPKTPIFAMMARIRSLADTPKPSLPPTVMRSVAGFLCQSCWVAIACMTSDAPAPKARVPNAPWVEVCESAPTMISPGWVMPCSGGTMWSIPCRGSSMPNRVTPCFAVLA